MEPVIAVKSDLRRSEKSAKSSVREHTNIEQIADKLRREVKY
jgi:hypothetical protein